MPKHILGAISIIIYWHHIIGDILKKQFLCFYSVCNLKSKELFLDIYCRRELKQVKHVIKDVYNIVTAVCHHCVTWFSRLSHLHALLGAHFKMMETLRIQYMFHNTFFVA